MSLLQRACKTLGVLGLVATIPATVFAQSGFVPQGGEYFPAGSLPGDQIHPSLKLNGSGGFLVWQDNITDGSGYGISAVRLDTSLSPTLGTFRVNQNGTNDQENPRVTLLNGGGAAFVWQGGKQSFQHIYARFLNSSNTFAGGDILVNTVTNKYQANPAIATLTNGNVIVIWSSYGQDNADGFQGIYAQVLSPTGLKIGGEFLVNQFTPFNQRTPAVAAFANGNFAVTWVSELERAAQQPGTNQSATVNQSSVDIYARLFNSTGAPLGNEFLVNTNSKISADPSIAAASDGTFIIAWCEKDLVIRNNSWDIFSRQFSGAGIGGAVQRVNTQLYGDQYAPQISSLGSDYLITWTSMGQDGSRQGIFGNFVHGNGALAGNEIRINTTVLNQQIYPAVASDNGSRFLVVWSSYVGGLNSLDLNAQRYVSDLQPLAAPGAPVVSAVDSYTLSVTWPPLAGFSVDHWELYVDGSVTPIILANLNWVNDQYNPGETHSFQLAYVLTDSRHSPLSASVSGKTWGADRNFDGLPDDWETMVWGANKSNWLPASARVSPGGPTALQVFLWGASPTDPSTWLTQSITQTPQGLFLNWNTRAGYIYEVQTCTDGVNWTSLGAPRFAAGTTDSIFLGGGSNAYYRITRLVY